jgi:predicted permease
MTWFRDRRRRPRAEVLHDELRAHIAMDQSDRMARGESQADAANNARRDFGNVGHVQDVTRDMWAGAWLDRLTQDVRFGLRILWRTPGFTIVAALCLALGIGANAVVFSWIESILFRPYPGVAAQDRLVAVAATSTGQAGYDDVSWPDFKDLERASPLFSSFIAAKIIGATVTNGERAERWTGQLVSANFFDALGVRPILGRGFSADEETGANAHPVTVINYRLWKDRFAGDPKVIGRTVTFNGIPHTIIGVTPPEFVGTFVGYAMQFWAPASMQPAFNGTYMLNDRSARWIEGFARLAPGVSLVQAQAALSVAAKRLETTFPNVDRGRGIRLLPLWAAPFDYAKVLAPIIRVAFVVVAFMLLIACANVANLLLVRSFARRQEMTVRLALGAGRERLLRQLITEGALLALIATVVGVVVAYWSRHSLSLFFAPRGGVNLNFSTALDWRVLALSATVGLTSTLAFSLVPALRSSNVDLTAALKADSRSSAGARGGSRLRSALVLLQVSMSFVLLVGAGLVITSLQRTRATSPGFVEDGVITTNVNLFSQGYDTARSKVFSSALLNRIQAIGGVQSAALAGTPMFEPAAPFGSSVIATDVYQPARDEQPTANLNEVSPDYFATLGIPILRGRSFTRADDDTTAPVAIVNETMAATFWPNADPVGKRLQAYGRWMQVVGVAKDIKYQSLPDPPRPLFYVPFRQRAKTWFAIHVRTRAGPVVIRPELVRELHALDPNVDPYEVLTMREEVERSMSGQRIVVAVLSVFASLALGLAAIGLYGVMSYVVSQSTRELGLRMALGAMPRDVAGLVLSRGLVLTTLGVVIGGAIAFGTTRLLGDLLFKVSPRDPVVFGAALGLMLLASVLACFLPAWRAARTDLVSSLRV